MEKVFYVTVCLPVMATDKEDAFAKASAEVSAAIALMPNSEDVDYFGEVVSVEDDTATPR